jgi:hypothetical protein
MTLKYLPLFVPLACSLTSKKVVTVQCIYYRLLGAMLTVENTGIVFGIFNFHLVSCAKSGIPMECETFSLRVILEPLRIAVFQAVMQCSVTAYPVCHDVIRNAYQLANQLLYFIDVQVRHSIG